MPVVGQKTSKNRFRLIRRIVARSVGKTWHEAKNEWVLEDIFYSEEPRSCLCGKTPIYENCVIQNKKNGNEVIVGNKCIQKFLQLGTSKLFQGICRVSQDRERSANQALVDHAFEKGFISLWEKTFLIDTMRKRKLSEKQRAKRSGINTTILECLEVG